MADRQKKERVGIVLSNKMNNTAIVQVTRFVQHPEYKKIIPDQRYCHPLRGKTKYCAT